MKKGIFCSLFAVLGLVAVFHRNVQPPQMFTHLDLTEERFAKEEAITLTVKALSEEESERYLQRNLIKWGYRPVQVTVDNRTSDPFLVDPQGVDLALDSASQVAKIAFKESIPRSIGLQVASLAFWPLSILSMMGSIKTMQTISHLKKSFAAKEFKKEVIAPFSCVSRILYIPEKEYEEKEGFTMSMINQETLETTQFSITSEDFSLVKQIHPDVLPLENYYLSH